MSSKPTVTRGSLTLEGDSLVVAVRYERGIATVLRQFEGATYDRVMRVWRIPIRHYPALKRSRALNPRVIDYYADEAEVQTLLKSYQGASEEAAAALAENPFFVSEEVVALSRPDIVFRLSPSGIPGIRAWPRRGSRVKRLLLKVPGIRFSKGERCYWFPAAFLRDFLQELRSTKLTFAVEQHTAETLQQWSDLRRSIVAETHLPSADELRRTLLAPYAETDPRDAHWFWVRALTPEQYGDLFPSREKLATLPDSVRLDFKGFCGLLHRAFERGIKIWLSRETTVPLGALRRRAEAAFSNLQDPFPEEALHFAAPRVAWWGKSAREAGLLIENSLLGSLSTAKDAPLYGRERLHLGPLHRHSFVPLTFSKFESEYQLLSDRLCEALRSPIPESRRFHELRQLALRSESARLRIEHFRGLADAEVPDLTDDERTRLYPHQRVAVQWLTEYTEGFLADDMGLGKTLAVLSGFSVLKRAGTIDFLLVICPNSLTRSWEREAERWFPDLSRGRVPSERRTRDAFLKDLNQKTPDIIIVHFESARLEAVREELRRALGRQRGILCIDESQRAKNPQSQTFKALRTLADSSQRRVLLSGTPTPRDVTDIWAQMRLLDRGRRLGTSYLSWLREVADVGTHFSQFAVARFKPAKVQETLARVHEVMLRRKKSDVLRLPEKVFAVREIELTGDQLERYEEIRRELLLRLTTLSGDLFFRAIDSVLEEYLRAVQIASNPRLVDETWKHDPAKFKELDAIVEEVVAGQEGKIVVWTNFLKNVDELVHRFRPFRAAAFSGEVDAQTRNDTIAHFQSDSAEAPQVLVAVPAAGGVGITLTAAQTAVYLDKTWNAEHWLQSIDRIHRIGQRGTVTIVSLHACPVDELIAKNLSRKEKLQTELLDPGETPRENALDQYPSREELLAALSG